MLFIPQTHEIHLWHTPLQINAPDVDRYFALLSPDEVTRALRFRFPDHKRRFIVARGVLRILLGQYLQIPPHDIELCYAARGKPRLKDSLNPEHLQFNVSHSHEIALYGFANNHAIGVDIEKIRDTYDQGIVDRFFSAHESAEFSKLSSEEKILKFYQLWTKKEAIIKAMGEGLFTPLNHFSVSLHKTSEMISISYAGQTVMWFLQEMNVHPDYQSAFATEQIIKTCQLREFIAL